MRRVNDAKRRKHHAVDQQEDIPHGALVNGVVLTLPRPRCKRETLSPQEIKPIHEPTGRANVGKSHYAGTNEENPRLTIQDKSRKHLAVDHQEDIPYRERPVSGVVLPLPRPRSNLCSHQGADTRFSMEEAIQKSPNWSMETAMQTAMQKELAAISQKMMDTLRKAQEETNSIMCREMQHIKT